jgi:shikimate kinase
MNIALIGYRGTGKTSVAKRLSQRLGWPWVDADDEIEAAAGKSIAVIFSDDGEERFRDLEVSVTAELTQRDQLIVAHGGGVVLREENRHRLCQLNSVVWLTASAATIHERLSSDPATTVRRPDLTTVGGLTEVVQLLAAREPLYRQCANVTIDTEGKAIDTIASDIMHALALSASDPKPQ